MSAPVDPTFDYLALIGLSPTDLERFWLPDLQGIIKGKKKEWTSQAINPLYQQQARANLERVRQFEQLLQSPETFQSYVSGLRELLVARRHEQEQEIGPLISLATGNRRNPLTLPQRELLAKEADERGIPAKVVDDLIMRLGLEVVPTEVDTAGLRIPYREPAMDKSILAQINRSLKVLGKKSFYEALDLSAKESPARIKSAARLQFEKWSKSLPKTAECVAWEKSMQACLTYLQDEESKERYDRAIYNARLDEFLRRVDLALAAGRLTRDAHVLLARVGVQEFGLMSSEVNQCIIARGVARGVPVTKPVQVTIQLEGQVRCARCFAWTPARNRNCTHCGGTLVRTCKNPACNQALATGAKVCNHCGLVASKGGQYAELLKLCDMLLDGGSVKPALDACRLAAQALQSPEIDRRVARATEIRTRIVNVRSAIADRRWLEVERLLRELAPLAPRLALPGIPPLEEVVQKLLHWRQALENTATAEESPATISTLVEVISQWHDCPDLSQRCLQLCQRLELQSRFQEALQLAEAVAALPGCQPVAAPLIARLQDHFLREKEAVTELNEARRNWDRAWTEQRLYAAERALVTLQELGDQSVSEADAAALRERLAAVREEVQSIQRLSAEGSPADELVKRHLQLLRICRDCRESLSALQQLSPLPPDAPSSLTVTLQGNRRLVRWQAPVQGKPPSGYILQRSWSRAGARQSESSFSPIGSRGSELIAEMQFLDEELAHNGDILQYSVQAAIRGTHDIDGRILREYTVASVPVVSEPILIWHEVLGLKARSISGGIELQWHRPAGVREILLERWPGHRSEAPAESQRLAGVDAPLYRDMTVSPETPWTYRVHCVYDGPQGEFITPGVCVTSQHSAATVPAEPVVEPTISTAPTAAPPVSNAVNGSSTPPAEAIDLAAIVQSAPNHSEADEAGHVNPLKRFGIWPPPPKDSSSSSHVESTTKS